MPGPGDLFDKFLAYVQRTRESNDQVAHESSGGSGILGAIDPTGLSLASLPLFGRAAGSTARNIAEHPGFIRRLLGIMDEGQIAGALEQARLPGAIEGGARMAEDYSAVANVLPDAVQSLERSHMRGAAEMAQNDYGRAILDLYRGAGLPPSQTVEVADMAAIKTLLELVGGR